jgi:hypothetical protein
LEQSALSTLSSGQGKLTLKLKPVRRLSNILLSLSAMALMVSPSHVPKFSTLSSPKLSVQVNNRPSIVGLAPLTVRIKVRRVCSETDRLLEVAIILDTFEDFYSAIDLEGCKSPKVFDFEREIRLPGDYIIAARIQPSDEMATATMEIR